MKITSKKTGNVLTWADIDAIETEELDPKIFKRITLNIEAGDIVTLEIETYCDEGTRYTKTKQYCVDKILIEANEGNELTKIINQSIKKKELKKIEETKRKMTSNSIRQIEL